MQIYIHRDGQQLGPYSIDAVREYVALGTLTADDLAWHEGAAEWQPLHLVIDGAEVEVEPEPEPAPVPAPAAVVEPPWVPPRRDGTTSIPFVRENRIPQSLTALSVPVEAPDAALPSPTASPATTQFPTTSGPAPVDLPASEAPAEPVKAQARSAKRPASSSGRSHGWALGCILLGVLFLLGGGVAVTLLAHHAVAGLRPGEVRVAGLGAVGLGGILFITGLVMFFKR